MKSAETIPADVRALVARVFHDMSNRGERLSLFGLMETAVMADRSTRPAQPVAPVPEAGDGVVGSHMPHSHDTATPALSVESEYVLVPREPTHEMLNHAQDVAKAGDGMSWNGRSPQMMFAEAWRAMLAAVPAPTSSPAAKGGEAGAVERLVDELACWMHGEVEWPDQHSGRSWPEHDEDTGARGHGAYATLVRMDAVHQWRDIARRMVKGFRLEQAPRAALATPSPQPANAVREAVMNKDDFEPRNALEDRLVGLFLAATPMGIVDIQNTLNALRAALASDPAPAGEAVEPVAWLCIDLAAGRAKSVTFSKGLAQDRERHRYYGSPAWEVYPLYAHPAPEDTARLREELERVTRERDTAENELGIALDRKQAFQETVDRVWKALGSPTYETLGGKSISEVVADLAKRASAAEQRAADALARIKELEFGAGFETAFDAVVRPGSRYENWTPADDPAEIVTDLYNDLEDALARAEKAERALETAPEDERDRLYQETMIAFNHSGYDESFRTAGIVLERWGAMLPAARAAARSASREGASDPAPATDDREKLTEAEWRLREDLREHWGAFCDCDPFPGKEDFCERMEAAGFIEADLVHDEDLEGLFASELGIEPGGMIWRLTDAGRAALATEASR